MAKVGGIGSGGGAGRRISSSAVYLGDGLYADYDGYQISLFAHNGYCETDTVYLEPRVLVAFEGYVKRLRERPQLVVQHMDGDPTNNDLSNLRIVEVESDSRPTEATDCPHGNLNPCVFCKPSSLAAFDKVERLRGQVYRGVQPKVIRASDYDRLLSHAKALQEQLDKFPKQPRRGIANAQTS